MTQFSHEWNNDCCQTMGARLSMLCQWQTSNGQRWNHLSTAIQFILIPKSIEN